MSEQYPTQNNFETLIAEKMQTLPEVTDQINAREEMLQRHSDAFGEGASRIMQALLVDLEHYAGFGSPRYKVDNPDFGDPNIDENGYLKLSNEPSYFSVQQLMPSLRHQEQELSSLSEQQKEQYLKSKDGMIVVGEPPEQVVMLLAEVYKFTDAKFVRNDIEHEESRGVVIREGNYLGEKVFFEEQYDEINTGTDTEPTFSLQLINEDAADFGIKDLTEGQYAELAAVTGMDRMKLTELVAEGEIRRDNVDSVAKLFKENGGAHRA
ncbi:hypothetical protein KC950_00125 [Candidatus Saccharibacteria bacterium]|nr:hypothetical protein [Candidatus Saccharibacteria bacterium]